MADATFKVPLPVNEPVLQYQAGSPEKLALKAALREAKSEVVKIPMIIGDQKIYTDNCVSIHPPHELSHTLGFYCKGDSSHVTMAIEAALEAKPKWEAMPWQERAAIFLKAADLLAGPYRAKMNAATMLGQSKNVFQSEIDAVCELADFLRFNVYFMTKMFEEQPYSPHGTWNKLELRPLEGFVFALTPFNFTSIAGNLCAAPALFGNVVVWKPSETQIYSSKIIMDIFKEAGLPDGVINLILVPGKTAGDVIFKHPHFAGLHFTGGTQTFQTLWKTIGENINIYKTYPRIVGETGGKDFVLAHTSADAKGVAVALSRGAFEYQGQKCSAASRAYIPSSLWNDVKGYLLDDLKNMSIGNPEDFTHFINAVIDEKSFDSLMRYIEDARKSDDCNILFGGNGDKSKGYFIEPTVIMTTNPNYTTMCEELFGPVLTIYVYDDNDWNHILKTVDQTSPYALTGAVFAQERFAIQEATVALKHAAGNFYINDKPTGAVVGQQPFGGARASGTNDKAGSVLNLWRWVSVRTIKENFLTPKDYRYPFLMEE